MRPTDIVDRAAEAATSDIPVRQMEDFDDMEDSLSPVSEPEDSAEGTSEPEETESDASEGEQPESDASQPEESEFIGTDDTLDQASPEDEVPSDDDDSDSTCSQTVESLGSEESDDVEDLTLVSTIAVEDSKDPEPPVATQSVSMDEMSPVFVPSTVVGGDFETPHEAIVNSDIETLQQVVSKDAEAPGVVVPIVGESEEAKDPHQVPFDEAAFVGATVVAGQVQDPESTEETQEPQITQDVIVDDAVPVGDVEAQEQKVSTDKSVYSATGTEETVSVADGGASSVASTTQDPSQFCSPRHIQIYVFSLVVIALIIASIAALLFGMGFFGGRSSSGADSATTPPTASPTASPTVAPTSLPLTTETSGANSPTASPTAAPTPAPTADLLLNLLRFSSGDRLDDITSPQHQAFQWLKSEDPIINSIAPDTEIDATRIYQRYALVTLYAALLGEIPAFASDDECTWPTVSCGTDLSSRAEKWQVTEINLARQSLTGSIPPEISLLSSSLVSLDMAENPELAGPIPNELYKLTGLKYLYLHNNALTGTISELIGNLKLLEDLYLGNNKLSGVIPANLASTQSTRVLRKVSLHNNMLEGSIPDFLNWPDAIYIDFSFNQFSGSLPSTPEQDFPSAHQLYFDHNQITGPIPDTYTTIGMGGLVSLCLNDNLLTGAVPATWLDGKKYSSTINTINVENNLLTEAIDRDVCRLSIFETGRLVDLRADCHICSCDSLFCEHC